MTNEEWIDMFRVIPEEEQNSIVLVLRNGAELSVDTLFRFEVNFLVMRGRVNGTTDEGRAFFIPYDQMVYYRIERITNLAKLRDFLEGRSGNEAPRAPVKVELPEPVHLAPPPAVPTIPTAPIPSTPITDATATRNALLDRIRAARATQNTGDRHLSQ